MNITIKILTPIHIGSGRELQPHVEFSPFPKENCIAVLDDEKVLAQIGTENIDAWMQRIESRKSIMDLMPNNGRHLQANDLALRQIKSYEAPAKPIREQLHSSNGQAMLPGTSLKGALRTAVFAYQINQQKDLVSKKTNLGIVQRNGKFEFKDAVLTEKIFGKDPNHDIMRLLSVGDALFDKTECVHTQVLNKYDNKFRIKHEIEQFVEVIPTDATVANIRLSFNETMYLNGKKMFNDNAKLLEIKRLFEIVRWHFGIIIGEEIDYWQEKANSPDEIGTYINDLEEMLAQINNCNENECIVRLGFGTGFRNMTGDWHGAMTDDDYYDMVKALRRNHPETLVFPKTTRFIKDGTPLGFVKLSVNY